MAAAADMVAYMGWSFLAAGSTKPSEFILLNSTVKLSDINYVATS